MNTIEIDHSSHHETLPVSGLYKEWFLDYASYVILERAVPDIADGLKPVQRRILHAMKELDDGRFNKIANVIGSTMQFHPHGDASIGEAVVGIGQRDLLIEMQGNWGDIRTGDNAAAARYIEGRLSKFALEVAFNPQITEWQQSYDGRKREPVALPMKFPLLLAQGTEGIAVGLATKILPHNFCELIKASMDILRGKEVEIFPDFLTGGMIDVSDYRQGLRGGKIRCRAKIEVTDAKTLTIKEIPFGTTTGSLMDSIVKANDAGKIKIKKVIDNTAKEVEIIVQLAAGVSADVTLDALYAFTDCEHSISPNSCVIVKGKPQFLGVNEMLKTSTDQTVYFLKRELEIKRHELKEKLLFASLEKIFIENRMYLAIENATTWEQVLQIIDNQLVPFKPQFYRALTQDDLVRLTEIKIKRISKFDAFKADELMRDLEKELQETEHHLAHLVEFAIDYFKNLLQKYGKGRERKTEIRPFDTILATKVVANNQKLYVNKEEGFVGYGLKKDEFVMDCSDIDDVIVFLRNGTFKVVKIAEKVFVGKDIVHAEIFNKEDDRKVFNMAYLDGENGNTMVKRFQIGGITRDKEYNITSEGKGTKVLYFSANPNGEAETISIFLTPACKAKIKVFDFDFKELEIKGRAAKGNILTKYPVKKLQLKSQGGSTLHKKSLYFDDTFGRLNTEAKGIELGFFEGEEKLLVLYKDGSYELSDYALTNRFEPKDLLSIQKFNPESVISAVYFDGETSLFFAKRFKIETSTTKKKFVFISEHPKSELLAVSLEPQAQVEVTFQKTANQVASTTYDFDILAELKGWKAKGNRLVQSKVKKVRFL